MNPTFQQLQIEVNDALHSLDSVQTQATPLAHPEKWNIQQIIQHLCLSYASTADVFETRLEKGRPTQTKPTVQQRLAQFFLFTVGLYPNGRTAPELVIPSTTEATASGNNLICSVAEHLTLLDALFDEAQALFGSGPCVTHVILGPLRVQQWRKFHLLHGDHHVKQILAIRASRRF